MSAGRTGLVNVAVARATPGAPPLRCAKADIRKLRDGIHPSRAMHALGAPEAIEVIAKPRGAGPRRRLRLRRDNGVEPGARTSPSASADGDVAVS